MKYIKTLIITILCLMTGQTAWAASSFTVENTTGTSKFVIKRTTNTSTTETVYYRTVSLSAIAGQHFTDKNGSLTFDANNNRLTEGDQQYQAGEEWPNFEYEKPVIVNGARKWWDEGFWTNKWYLDPVSRDEVMKGYGLTQNPGW